MAVPFFWLARDALDAKLHLQLLIDDVAMPTETPGEAIVSGEVVRVFRGGEQWLGSQQRLAIHVLRENDSPPPSGILWTRADDLARAVVVEAYANPGVGGVLHVAGSQSSLLAAPSDVPARVITEEDTREPPRPRPSLDTLVTGFVEAVLVFSFFALVLLGFVYAAWYALR